MARPRCLSKAQGSPRSLSLCLPRTGAQAIYQLKETLKSAPWKAAHCSLWDGWLEPLGLMKLLRPCTVSEMPPYALSLPAVLGREGGKCCSTAQATKKAQS